MDFNINLAHSVLKRVIKFNVNPMSLTDFLIIL